MIGRIADIRKVVVLDEDGIPHFGGEKMTKTGFANSWRLGTQQPLEGVGVWVYKEYYSNCLHNRLVTVVIEGVLWATRVGPETAATLGVAQEELDFWLENQNILSNITVREYGEGCLEFTLPMSWGAEYLGQRLVEIMSQIAGSGYKGRTTHYKHTHEKTPPVVEEGEELVVTLTLEDDDD